MRKSLLALVSVVIVGLLFGVAPKALDARTNTTAQGLTQSPSEHAKTLHKELFVADMHSDTLLWPLRNIFERLSYGHVDVPRLLEGNVALAGFTVVTGVPITFNFQGNPAPSLWTDLITFKAAIEMWGWNSLTTRIHRALLQLNNAHTIATQSNGTITIIKSKNDLKQYVERRTTDKNITAIFLGIEGAHCIDEDINNVDVLYDHGVRMMALSHFFDTTMAGSAHGLEKGGVTEFGKQVLQRMEQKKILVDVAHASSAAIHDIIRLSTRPILNSHTGVKGVCNHTRNIDDDHIRGIAKSGGLIAVGFFKPALCGNDPIGSLVQTVKYIRDMVGINHVALGSDFDGTIQTVIDASGFVHLTDRFIQEGLTDEEIKLVMGDNLKNLFLKYLPDV